MAFLYIENEITFEEIFFDTKEELCTYCLYRPVGMLVKDESPDWSRQITAGTQPGRDMQAHVGGQC